MTEHDAPADAVYVASDSNGHQELSAEARCRLLLEISHTVRGTLDLRETLDRLLDGLQLLMPFDAGGIFVLREEVSHATSGRCANRSPASAGAGSRPVHRSPTR